jgi:hypothetical protein
MHGWNSMQTISFANSVSVYAEMLLWPETKTETMRFKTKTGKARPRPGFWEYNMKIQDNRTMHMHSISFQ